LFLFYVFGRKILNARPDVGSGMKLGMRRQERTGFAGTSVEYFFDAVISTFYRASNPALASDSTISPIVCRVKR
jgi:hypothetical protein